MSRNTHHFAKCKIFCADPAYLQRILDEIGNTFGNRVILSSIKPSQEGDYHAYVTWTEAA
jgi:hypothetical protein